MQEKNEKDAFPCLYIPDATGGAWVVSNPTGRKIKIRFPENPDEGFLVITDISTNLPELPDHHKRVSIS